MLLTAYLCEGISVAIGTSSFKVALQSSLLSSIAMQVEVLKPRLLKLFLSAELISQVMKNINLGHGCPKSKILTSGT